MKQWIQTGVVLLAGMFLLSGCATPLQNAARNGNTTEVQRLLDSGVGLNEKNEALRSAARNGQVKTVSLLLDRGATDGGSALLVAAIWGHAETVRQLLSKGIDANTKNIGGETAADLARRYGHSEIVQLIDDARMEHTARVVEEESVRISAELQNEVMAPLLERKGVSSEAFVSALTTRLITVKNSELPAIIVQSTVDQRIALVTSVENRLAEAQTMIVELTGKAEDAVRKGQDSSGYRRHIGKLQAYMAVLAEMKNMLMQS